MSPRYEWNILWKNSQTLQWNRRHTVCTHRNKICRRMCRRLMLLHLRWVDVLHKYHFLLFVEQQECGICHRRTSLLMLAGVCHVVTKSTQPGMWWRSPSHLRTILRMCHMIGVGCRWKIETSWAKKNYVAIWGPPRPSRKKWSQSGRSGHSSWKFWLKNAW